MQRQGVTEIQATIVINVRKKIIAAQESKNGPYGQVGMGQDKRVEPYATDVAKEYQN